MAARKPTPKPAPVPTIPAGSATNDDAMWLYCVKNDYAVATHRPDPWVDVLIGSTLEINGVKYLGANEPANSFARFPTKAARDAYRSPVADAVRALMAKGVSE